MSRVRILSLILLGRFHNVRSLRSTSAFNDFELYALAFCQSLKALILNCREMNEYIAAIFSLNKTITFFCAKPFYFTNHFETSYK